MAEVNAEAGEWRCRCPSDPEFDTSVNKIFIKRCGKCGMKRPKPPEAEPVPDDRIPIAFNDGGVPTAWRDPIASERESRRAAPSSGVTLCDFHEDQVSQCGACEPGDAIALLQRACSQYRKEAAEWEAKYNELRNSKNG